MKGQPKMMTPATFKTYREIMGMSVKGLSAAMSDDTESCYFDGEVEIQVEEDRRFWKCPECNEMYWEDEGW